MTSALFIASKPIASYDHMYLVYDPDGSLAVNGTLSGDELVLRGTPTTPLSGFISIEGGVAIADSLDGAFGNGGVEPDILARNFTLLATGSSADSDWSGVLTWAASVTSSTFSPGTTQDTFINYSLSGSSPDFANTTNSNSVIASALSSVGIDIYSNLPVVGGDLDGNGISDTSGTTTRLQVSDVPGVNAHLSGSLSNTFDGGETAHDNLFVDGAGSDHQGGDDTFYGGPVGVQVLTNNDPTVSTRDGTDTFVYLTQTVEPLQWSLTKDGTVPIGLQVQTPDGHTDTLYSVERVFSTSFTTTSTLNFTNLNGGVDVHDVDLNQLGSLNNELKVLNNGENFVTTAVNLDLGGGQIVTFGNIGSFTGTNYDDTFALNTLLGRTFDGGGGTDTMDFSGITGGKLIIDLSHGLIQQPLAYASLGAIVVDTPHNITVSNIENVVGSIYNDTLIGTSGIDGLTGGRGDDSLTGGAEADAFVFGLNHGADTITDYHHSQDDALIYVDGITFSSLTFERSGPTHTGTDEIIHDGGNQQVTLLDFFSDPNPGLSIQFGTDPAQNYHVNSDGSVTAVNDIAAASGSGVTLPGTTGDDFLNGTGGNDDISGQAGNDFIVGHAGADALTGDDGNDVVYGGDGNDVISGGNGDDCLYGEAGDDIIHSDAGHNLVYAGSGDDTIYLDPAGHDTVYGGSGDDTVTASQNLDAFVDGGAGADVLQDYGSPSGTPHNTLIGGADNDTVIGAGDDILVDGDGVDVYTAYENATIIAATDGVSDGFYGDISSSATLDLSASTKAITLSESGGTGNLVSADLGNGTVGSYFNLIIGGSGDDTFTYVGASYGSTLNGGAGNDYFESGLHLIGGAGADTFAVNPPSGYAPTVMDYSAGEGDEILLKGLASPGLNDISHLVGARSGDDLLLEVSSVGTPSNAITLHDFFLGSLQKIIVDFNDDSLGTIGLNVASDGTLTQDSGTGTSGVDILAGASGGVVMLGLGGDDTLTGNTGNDTLDGGPGADTLNGGTGNDVYAVESPGDVVSENASEGTDTVLASVSYTLTANVENLTLIGSDAIDGTGNGGDNVITGNSATNALAGAAGSDTYVFGEGSGLDVVTDTAGTLDTISFDATVASSSAIYARIGDDLYIGYGTAGDSVTVTGFFSGGDNIEQVTFSDSTVHDATYINAHLQIFVGTSGDDTLTGSTSDDILIGLAGNDTLGSLSGNDTLDGGVGADSMTGGTGNDLYVVDDAGDVVTENSGEGTDQVQASVNYTLANYVENLTLTGSDSINGTGNGSDNVITGNSGDNTLAGAAGSDTYIFSEGSGLDVVTDSSGTLDTISFDATVAVSSVIYTRVGNDLIVAYGTVGDSVTVTGYFSGSDTIEQITFPDSTVHDATYIGGHLLSATGTSGDDTITGGSGADTISGLDGNDVLYGMGGNDSLNGGNGNDTLDGGIGNDIMTGGAGNDIYVVDSTSDSVTESASSGTDTVLSSVNWTIATDFENLTLNGAGTINGTGNSGNNVITGNSAANTLTGNGGNDTLDGGGGADKLVGGTGNDTYIVDVSGDSITDSGGTDLVLSSASTYTLSTGLENLTLAGSADISGTGNSSVNTITGNGGNDTLDGGAGADVLIGGSGNDTYGIDNAGDSITDTGGTDTILSSITLSLASFSNIENLTLAGTSAINGTGNSGVNIITGNSGVNILTGNGGNDTLDGGGGADTLIGGTGNDTYIVDVSGDSITDTGGTDLVLSSLSTYTLGSGLENLTLSGTSNINGTGNSGVNIITGNSGNNTLDGGTGADTLIGGLGDDTYLVDNASDSITEATNGGTDTVQTGTSYTLASGQEIENLTLTGASVLSGTGNGLANVITANSAADTLTGGDGNDTYIVTSNSTVIVETSTGGTADTVQYGGSLAITLASNVENLTLTGGVNDNGVGNTLDNVMTGNTGANSLTGGAGNDTYYVQNAMDVAVESTSGSPGGTDIVYSTVSFTLGTNVENLTLTGSTAVIGTGNASDNILVGNSASNTLDGMGGTDSLVGGDGNDTYFVDVSTDVIVENSGEGTDIAQFSGTTIGTTYTLANYVENLTLTGTVAINGTGNTLDNTLTGNTGNNVLTGGAGNDSYVVQNTGDSVVEGTSGTSGGTDLVMSSVTFTLGTNVENLTLTGSSLINGIGNELANVITGNSAANTLNGGAGDDTLDGAGGANSLIGGDGNDTFYVLSSSDVVVEGSLTGSGTDIVYANLSSGSYTLSANVENLTLTGTGGAGIGNSLVNIITGSSGSNSLDGGTGADTLIGGAGSDTYFVDNTADVIVENPGEGTDVVQFTSTTTNDTYTLSANVENLTLAGTANINGTGSSDVNTITGNSGANTLDGGGGADSLVGGAGNDTYIVDDTNDVITEMSSGGTDIALSTASTYTLGSNVENLTLSGTGDINGTGNSAVNIITGNSGNNTLDGGSGADTMIGGLGNDVYIVDNASDIISTDTGGTDTVQSSVSFSIAALTSIENLTLTGSLAVTATGNSGDNILTGSSIAQTLTGNGGNDTLDGGGGADTLIGGTGNDTYVIDNAGDTITDTGGHDVVLSGITYTLASNLEDLTLTGSSAINGTGNASTNIITGNSGDNSLDGGTGTDTLIGGLGNDTYVVDTTTDVITENASQGSDTILSSVTFDLSANAMYANVENLTLSGSSALNGTGNSLDNVITGNSGANTLSGGSGVDTLDGGDGLDSLTGGTGGDTFLFHFATAVNNIDVVTDFSTAEGDKLDIKNLLTGYDIHQDITHWVRISDSGGNSIVEIDHDGTNGMMYGWQQVATLTGVTGLTDEAALLASGNLIAS